MQFKTGMSDSAYTTMRTRKRYDAREIKRERVKESERECNMSGDKLWRSQFLDGGVGGIKRPAAF